jgi:putative tricarboxylic transport membrane protein
VPGRRDRWSAAGLAAVAVAYLLANRAYPLDTLASPGPGVFPLAVGIALLGLAVWQWVTAGHPSRTAAREPAAVRSDDAPTHLRAALLMALALVVYAAALPRVGFLVTSFALVLVAARLMGLPGWWRPAALALGVTLACRLIFVSWLRVPLP